MKQIFFLLLVLDFVVAGCGKSSTAPAPPPDSMVSIAAPADGARLTSMPVSMEVSFAGSADPTQMKASLNGKDVTALFGTASDGVRKAQVKWPNINFGRNVLLVSSGSKQTTSSFIVNATPTQTQNPATSLLVPIRTRIVTGDGTHAGDYSVQVGSNTYTAPGLANGGTGFQVVILDRATLNLVANNSYPTDTTSGVNGLISDLDPKNFNTHYEGCGALGCMVAVQSLYKIGTTPCGNSYSAGCSTSSYAALFQALGGSADVAFATGSEAQASYSLITNIGAGGTLDFSVPAGSAYERVACNSSAQPDCGWLPAPGFIGTGDAAISGALILDNHRAYTFAYTTPPVTFSTGVGASPTQNTITVDGTPYASASIASGQGGFQVVVLNRTTLDLIANETFPFSQLGIMLDTIDSLNNYNNLFFIASIGSMYHATPPLELAWDYVGEGIQQIGGNYPTFIRVDDSGGLDDYSLVGAHSNPNSGLATFYGAEASTIISIPTLGKRVHSNIQGVLALDHRGYYSPVLASTNSSFGTNNLALITSASMQPPTEWPYPEQGQSGQASAYVWISQALCCDDIRSQYSNLNALPTVWLPLLESVRYPTGQSFSRTDFDVMRSQLLKEFQYLAAVRLFESNIGSFYQNQQGNVSLLLTQAYDAVQNDLQTPPPTPVKRPSALGMLEGAQPIAEDMLSVAGPVGGAIRTAVDLSFYTVHIAMESANDGNGIPLAAPPTQGQIAEVAASELAGDAANTFAASLVTLGNGFDRITTDWGRLQAIGEPLVTGQILWSSDASGFALQGFDRAARREYYEKFFGALYGIEHREKASVGSSPDEIHSSCTGRDYGIDQPAVLAIPSSPTGSLPSNGNDQQNYDGYILLNKQNCSAASSTLPNTFNLFAPIDPNRTDYLGEYAPYFFTRGPVPIVQTDTSSSI